MAYYTDKVSLVRDSMGNIDLFRLTEGNIIRYHFDRKSMKNTEAQVAKDIHMEYDVYIDRNDIIYLIYQDKAMDLIFSIIRDEKMESVKLTEEPMPEIYYLNMLVIDGVPHVFYFTLLSGKERKYRIYHHYLEKDKWITHMVDDIKVRELLNPMSILRTDGEILLSYYDYTDSEHIFIKNFNLESKTWEERTQLTDNRLDKLYIDMIYKENKLHLVYCQYEEGNLQVRYERYRYEKGFVNKEIEEEISNYEGPENPTLIYYDNKLWITWVELDRVLSRYSDDNGETWSPIYLWKESRKSNIVRYKYSSIAEDEGIILNYSFGKFSKDLSFIGFGPLDNIEVVPLKKKSLLRLPRDLPRIKI
ncbi:MAG TPA: hypothetical protein GXX53_04060 [Tissierellia bacterium]|nr:hypothetical protein [Tissierellia bacterium]